MRPLSLQVKWIILHNAAKICIYLRIRKGAGPAKDNRMRHWVKMAVIAAAGIIVILFLDYYQGSSDGEEIFRREGCITCHSFRGHGGGSGPDLTGVSQRRSPAWIHQQIVNPLKHNQDSRMPGFSHLSGKELSALIKYLKTG